MVDNQPVFTNLIECCHDDVISDVIVGRFRLKFSAFRVCEYNNLIGSHALFTKLNMVDNQPVLTNINECPHDDVISDFTVDWFRLDRTLMKVDA